MGPGLMLPEHKFLLDPLQEEPTRGSVVSSSASRLNISFNDPVDLDAAQSGWRIDLGQSQYIFDLMKEAVYAFNHNVAKQEPPRFLVEMQRGAEGVREPVQKQEQYILRGTHLRDVLLRSFQPSEHPHPHRALQSPDEKAYVDRSVMEHPYHREMLDRETTNSQADVNSRVTLPTSNTSGVFQNNMLIHSWATRYSRPNPVVVEGDPPLDGMNESQIRAMAMMIGERISLVQGPPGTGKTKTIIEAIRLLKSHFRVPEPLLVCTYTNVAVDNLVEGLASAFYSRADTVCISSILTISHGSGANVQLSSSGAMLGFVLARFMNLHPPTMLEGVAHGEAFWLRSGIYKVAMLVHLGAILPAGFLAAFQFVSIIRYNAIIVHRLARYPCQGSSLSKAVALAVLSLSSTTVAWFNIKKLQIDRHRKWMLRTWFDDTVVQHLSVS
ncbi:hypothetical protein PQX77_016821 [Marasmius sp. AFHP31]|nr:hypothetical protein PQX77_016821 [Marasmius sp. AFHP31]